MWVFCHFILFLIRFVWISVQKRIWKKKTKSLQFLCNFFRIFYILFISMSLIQFLVLFFFFLFDFCIYWEVYLILLMALVLGFYYVWLLQQQQFCSLCVAIIESHCKRWKEKRKVVRKYHNLYSFHVRLLMHFIYEFSGIIPLYYFSTYTTQTLLLLY